jgi:hypothetical protein
MESFIRDYFFEIVGGDGACENEGGWKSVLRW